MRSPGHSSSNGFDDVKNLINNTFSGNQRAASSQRMKQSASNSAVNQKLDINNQVFYTGLNNHIQQ
jgi:hypothetical protein